MVTFLVVLGVLSVVVAAIQFSCINRRKSVQHEA